MKKTLYLVRHGETIFNKQHRIQGACDSPLSQEGISQAKKTKVFFESRGIVFDHAYASTQERASDTLECITSQPYTRLKGLKEWNFGLFEGEHDYLNPKLDPLKGSYGDYFVAYGGESDVQVQQRVNETLLHTMRKDQHNKVLVVSHGGAIFMFLKKWVEEDIVKSVPFKNCCILEFTFEDDIFHFEKSYVDHLG